MSIESLSPIEEFRRAQRLETIKVNLDDAAQVALAQELHGNVVAAEFLFIQSRILCEKGIAGLVIADELDTKGVGVYDYVEW